LLTVTCITAVKCILPLLFESPSYYNLHVTSLSCIQFVRKFMQSINNSILCKEFCTCNDAIVLVVSELVVSTHVIQAGMQVVLHFRIDKESTHLVTVAKLRN